MKKILFTLSLLSIVGFTTPAFAQQQINNDGANAGELQQQNGSEDIQQNTNAQQATDISQNAGASVLQNAPNQPLNVIGAPANSAVKDTEKDTKWVLLFIILFAILIGPAVVYLREMQVAEQALNTSSASTKKSPVKSTEEAENKEPSKAAVSKNARQSTAKKKSKKSTASRAKRGKKTKK